MATITKKEMVALVSEKLGEKPGEKPKPAEVADTVNALLECISEQLEQGKAVIFRGFGSFSLTTTKAKVGRNPKKPEQTVMIPESTKVRFKVGRDLKARVAAK